MKKLLLLLSVVLGLSASAQTDTTLTSFQGFPDIEDGTTFTYDAEAMALYQNGKYLFARSIVPVTDDEGNITYYSYPALLYGNAGQTYTLGDAIPAGWEGTKTTYNGMPEAQINGLEATTGQVEHAADGLAAPIDYTGYIKYMTMDEYKTGFAAEYVTLGPVTISDVDGRNFSISEEGYDEYYGEYETYTVPGYNKFDKIVTLPTDLDREYVVTGFCYLYNGEMQFWPISIEPYYPVKTLYSVWWSGEEGTTYRIYDELYVVAPTMAQEPEEGSENYIYITDNKWVYEYYGYIFDWTPTYMAIDCQGNEELYDEISHMDAIKINTLLGTYASSTTNRRLLVDQAPEASDNTTEWKFTELNLDEKFRRNGHEIYGVTGFYNVIDGQEVLMGYDYENGTLYQPFKLDRRYIGDVALEIGAQYHFDRVVVKQLERWSNYDPIQEVKGVTIPQEFKFKALNDPKNDLQEVNNRFNMNPEDPNYNTNIILCPLDADGIQATGATGINEVNTGKQVSKVEYVNVAGQTSDVPFDGVNIMVTRYTDGSSVATKVVK